MSWQLFYISHSLNKVSHHSMTYHTLSTFVNLESESIKKKEKYPPPFPTPAPGYVPRRPPQRWAQWALKGETNFPRRTCHYGRQRPQELNGCEDGRDRPFTGPWRPDIIHEYVHDEICTYFESCSQP